MEMLKQNLERTGFEVLTATTAQEALRLLMTELIEGVLLEYDLPDATSASLRAEMKLLQPDVPVLLFNGLSDQTPLLLRFFASYLRNPRLEDGEW